MKTFASRIKYGVPLSAFAVTPAFAQTTIDTTDAVANIALGVTAVGLIGAALLGLFALIKAWKSTQAAVV